MEKILNVGCGNSTFGTHFVDLYPSRKEVIKCNIDAEKLPFSNSYFDVVYSSNVFEHLTNCGFVMKEMHRVLKKNGKLILITDNANYWGWSFNSTHSGGYEEVRKPAKRTEDRHFSLFTEWHLKNHAKNAGFHEAKTSFVLDKQNLRNRIIMQIVARFNPKIAYGQIKLEAIK